MTVGRPPLADARLAAVELAQATVMIHLRTWARNPTRETRQRLEEALIACDDAVDRLLCPQRLSNVTLREQRR